MKGSEGTSGPFFCTRIATTSSLFIPGFYDPQHTSKYPKGKLRIVKGMNEFHTLAERREAVKALMETELNELKCLGFNPITGRHELPASAGLLISPETPLIDALQKAADAGGYVGRTRTDLRGVIRHITAAAMKLRIEYDCMDILCRR